MMIPLAILLGFLDLSAAFDTVDHESHDILLKRLLMPVGISRSVLAWFPSFLNDRTLAVSFQNVNSPIHSTPA